MSLPLSAQRLAAIYECLRAFPPFNRWALPPASDVKFVVTRHVDQFGDHFTLRDTHHVRVSSAKSGHFETVVITVAHEMVHMRQARIGIKVNHGNFFKRQARSICRRFGWDEKAF